MNATLRWGLALAIVAVMFALFGGPIRGLWEPFAFMGGALLIAGLVAPKARETRD